MSDKFTSAARLETLQRAIVELADEGCLTPFAHDCDVEFPDDMRQWCAACWASAAIAWHHAKLEAALTAVPPSNPDPELERRYPDSLLMFAVTAPSQYSEEFRLLAAEILRLREMTNAE